MVAVIRERRQEDLEPLCAVLAEVDWPPAATSDADRLEWLERLPANRSWVFDAAPVSVAPTRNVRAHLQIVPVTPEDASWVATIGLAAANLLVLTGLVVRPGVGEDGIRRFLLRESIRHCRDRGCTAVLDLADCPGLSPELAVRYGFTPLRPADRGPATAGDPGMSMVLHEFGSPEGPVTTTPTLLGEAGARG